LCVDWVEYSDDEVEVAKVGVECEILDLLSEGYVKRKEDAELGS
jgi:hypothetical protein